MVHPNQIVSSNDRYYHSSSPRCHFLKSWSLDCVWVNSEAAQCHMKLECSRKGKTVLQQLEVIHMFLWIAIRARLHQWPRKLGEGLANFWRIRSLLSCNLIINSLFSWCICICCSGASCTVDSSHPDKFGCTTHPIQRSSAKISVLCLTISNGSFSEYVRVKIAYYSHPYSWDLEK